MNLRRMVAISGGLWAALSLSAVAFADPALYAPPSLYAVQTDLQPGRPTTPSGQPASPAESLATAKGGRSLASARLSPISGQLSTNARNVAGVAKVQKTHAQLKAGHGGEAPVSSPAASPSAGGGSNHAATQKLSAAARNVAGVQQVQATVAKEKGGHGGARPADGSDSGHSSAGRSFHGGGSFRSGGDRSNVRPAMTHATLSGGGARASHCHGNGVCL